MNRFSDRLPGSTGARLHGPRNGQCQRRGGRGSDASDHASTPQDVPRKDDFTHCCCVGILRVAHVDVTRLGDEIKLGLPQDLNSFVATLRPWLLQACAPQQPLLHRPVPIIIAGTTGSPPLLARCCPF